MGSEKGERESHGGRDAMRRRRCRDALTQKTSQIMLGQTNRTSGDVQERRRTQERSREKI